MEPRESISLTVSVCMVKGVTEKFMSQSDRKQTGRQKAQDKV